MLQKVESLRSMCHAVFGKSTGVAAKLAKGTWVEVSNRLYIRAYMGTDSEPKASLNLHCSTIKVNGITGKKENLNQEDVGQETRVKTTIENIAAITEPADDIPF